MGKGRDLRGIRKMERGGGGERERRRKDGYIWRTRKRKEIARGGRGGIYMGGGRGVEEEKTG